MPGTWKLQSNVTLNGHDLAKDIRSAISRTESGGSGTVMVVELTTASDYCALLRGSGCLADGEVVVTLTFEGTSAKDYPAATQIPPEAGSIEAFMSGVDNGTCTGAGIGLDSGHVVVSKADLAAGGGVSLDIDLSSAFGDLTGTVEAPFCDGIPE